MGMALLENANYLPKKFYTFYNVKKVIWLLALNIILHYYLSTTTRSFLVNLQLQLHPLYKFAVGMYLYDDSTRNMQSYKYLM